MHTTPPTVRLSLAVLLLALSGCTGVCEYFRNEMKPPEGGLAEVARRQWEEVTRPEQLKKLIQMGRERLAAKK